ncbi:tetratricopeptide repeat protein [Roseibacillus ishigakijimensis]|uniref:Tetratricopeptide repeat protein n=1 Tax=Roseibacillus ishigakijimensis TaxID=454146 RepID=A0A934RPU6_9BACT|nr:tetratricopeptide repeat protein [Roseibacillus ishigakijimensis]MBK1833381.1 tetratricopeptide repeat protein [Roseibacillus ishigakijimensis]
MKFCALLLGLAFLTACSSFRGDAPPLQGTVRGDNPRAATLYQNGAGWEAAGDYKKALKSYRTLLKDFPADKRAAEARFREATILTALGEERDAFDAYQLFIERHPGNALYPQAVSQQEAVAHAAASGDIRTSFLGLKSRLDRKTIVSMLEKVRDNAPHAASAPRAQYMIGQVNESRKKADEAIAAYGKLVDDYPNSSNAPDAQFRIGEILLKQARDGNQDQANLERARSAYNDLLLAYPGSSFAPQAKQRIATIGSRDLQASYDVAEFYRKKGELDSAAYYYQEVIDGAAPGELRNRAAARLAALKQ